METGNQMNAVKNNEKEASPFHVLLFHRRPPTALHSLTISVEDDALLDIFHKLK